MLKSVDFYYFSPTGGTKKAGDALVSELAAVVNEVNLAEKTVNNPSSDVVVVAAPVFGGRIPAMVSDRIAKINGEGAKAITAVVYGVRAYEDALLRLMNDSELRQRMGLEALKCKAAFSKETVAEKWFAVIG